MNNLFKLEDISKLNTVPHTIVHNKLAISISWTLVPAIVSAINTITKRI